MTRDLGQATLFLMHKIPFLTAVALLSCLATSCAQTAQIKIPSGVVDCGTNQVKTLVTDVSSDVDACLSSPKDDGCSSPTPSNPTQTTCSWKKCLWDLVRNQVKSVTSEALLCAVNQAGIDLKLSAEGTPSSPVLATAAERAHTFVAESGVTISARPPVVDTK